jgi:putative flippase GtrA
VNQFLRFAIVGAAGFVTDFAVLYVAVSWFGLHHLGARLLSFLVAATLTWKANRHFTFRRNDGGGALRQWMQYLLATALGGLINIGVYQLWLTWTDTSTVNLFLGVVAGSAVAMLFNFVVSKRFVFAG